MPHIFFVVSNVGKGVDFGTRVLTKLKEIASDDGTREITLEDTGTSEFLHRTLLVEEEYLRFFTLCLVGLALTQRFHGMRGDLSVDGHLCEFKQILKYPYSKYCQVGIRHEGQQICNPNLGNRLTQLNILYLPLINTN